VFSGIFEGVDRSFALIHPRSSAHCGFLLWEGAIVRFAALIAASLITIGLGGDATAADIPGLAAHTPWKKFCFNKSKTGLASICDTRAEARKWDDHSLLAAVEMIEREGEAKKYLRIVFPLGVQLSYGTRLILNGMDPQLSPFVSCTAAGCMSDYEATATLLRSMRAGEGLGVQAIDQFGKPLTITLSLADFRAAYDGPGIEAVTDEIEEPRREKPPKPWLDDALRPELRPRIR
jgi:invasion protein IalB